MGAQNFSRDWVNGDMVSFVFDGEPVRLEGRCPRTYNVERIEVAPNVRQPTSTMSARDNVTRASDQRQHSTGAQSRGHNNVTGASAQSQSNVETQFSASQMEALAKMFADLLAQSGITPVTTRV